MTNTKKESGWFTEDDRRIVFRTEEELAQPGVSSGRFDVYRYQHWVWHPTKGAVLFKPYGPRSKWVCPQTNSDPKIVEMLAKKLYPWAEIRLIPFAMVETPE